MTDRPEADTKVAFLQVGMRFYHLGEWHIIKSVQPKGRPPEGSPSTPGSETHVYVTTEGERTFVMRKEFFVAVDLEEATVDG